MAALSVGDPFEPATEVGPLVNAQTRDTIAAQVEDARAKGATILCGGEPVVGPEGPDRPGFFYRPTVITGITPDMRVANEELFGPLTKTCPDWSSLTNRCCSSLSFVHTLDPSPNSVALATA